MIIMTVYNYYFFLIYDCFLTHYHWPVWATICTVCDDGAELPVSRSLLLALRGGDCWTLETGGVHLPLRGARHRSPGHLLLPVQLARAGLLLGAAVPDPQAEPHQREAAEHRGSRAHFQPRQSLLLDPGDRHVSRQSGLHRCVRCAGADCEGSVVPSGQTGAACGCECMHRSRHPVLWHPVVDGAPQTVPPCGLKFLKSMQ